MKSAVMLLAVACGLASGASIPPRARLARSLRGDQIAKIVRAAPADASISVPIVMPREWLASARYAPGEACIHEGGIYLCVQGHQAQAGWHPSVVPALWRRVRAPGESPGDIPAWRQPLGAHDAYALGALVRHAGKVWESTVAANVWEPGVYGWTQKD